MEQALAHALDSDEAEPLVEAHGLGLGVGDDPDAADAVEVVTVLDLVGEAIRARLARP